MKKYYIAFVFTLSAFILQAQGYQFSLVFVDTNPSTGNYQMALVATPDFEQTTPAPTADMGAAIYIPSGYTLGNFATGNSNLQFFEWQNSQENSYDGGTTDLVQLLRTDIQANDFTHTVGQAIELVLFDIISDSGNGNNPTSGQMVLAENTDQNVIDNFYESYININLQDGNGTQDYFLSHNPAANSINFATLSLPDNSLQKEIKIFPNPTSEYINITSTLELNKVELFDLLGKRVLDTVKTSQIKITHLQAGIYLLKVHTTNGMLIKKIMIE